GPTHAVMSLVPRAPHRSAAMSPAGTAGSFVPAGCPERSRAGSGEGPCAPKIFGEWQSLQPVIVASHLPRSMTVGSAALAAETSAAAAREASRAGRVAFIGSSWSALGGSWVRGEPSVAALLVGAAEVVVLEIGVRRDPDVARAGRRGDAGVHR